MLNYLVRRLLISAVTLVVISMVIFGILKIEEVVTVRYAVNAGTDEYLLRPDGTRVVLGEYYYRRLVHGTTLHGTQVFKHEPHLRDTTQVLPAGNGWHNLVHIATGIVLLGIAAVQASLDRRTAR